MIRFKVVQGEVELQESNGSDLGAKAFGQGANVHFGRPANRGLHAHEATHVVQQGTRATAGMQRISSGPYVVTTGPGARATIEVNGVEHEVEPNRRVVVSAFGSKVEEEEA